MSCEGIFADNLHIFIRAQQATLPHDHRLCHINCQSKVEVEVKVEFEVEIEVEMADYQSIYLGFLAAKQDG